MRDIARPSLLEMGIFFQVSGRWQSLWKVLSTLQLIQVEASRKNKKKMSFCLAFSIIDVKDCFLPESDVQMAAKGKWYWGCIQPAALTLSSLQAGDQRGSLEL